MATYITFITTVTSLTPHITQTTVLRPFFQDHPGELVLEEKLVSWSLTSLFSTNMAISETKGQGWIVIRTQ